MADSRTAADGLNVRVCRIEHTVVISVPKKGNAFEGKVIRRAYCAWWPDP